jgi:hypothetical protein
LMEFGWVDDPGLLFAETIADRPVYREERDVIYAFSQVFDQLVERALSPDQTVAMLRDLAGRLPDHDC